MNKVMIGLLLAILILGGVIGAFMLWQTPQTTPPSNEITEAPQACAPAEQKLAGYFNQLTLPRSCDQDADCQAFSLPPSASGCTPPLIFSKSAEQQLAGDQVYQYLHAQFQQSCVQEIASLAPCAIPAEPVCINHVCENQQLIQP